MPRAYWRGYLRLSCGIPAVRFCGWIEEEELRAVELESTHTVDIIGFVPKSDIDKRYLDKPYYVTPQGKAGADAFAVIRDAMKDKDRVALAKKLVRRKAKGHSIEEPAPDERADNVINLMDALRQSLGRRDRHPDRKRRRAKAKRSRKAA
jgi:non-homologous end joining protein Ku